MLGISPDLVIEALIFCIVVAVAVAITEEIERVAEQRRRLGEQSFNNSASSGLMLDEEGAKSQFFRWVQSSTSLSDSGERQKMRRELALAGFDFPSAPIWYVIIRYSLALLLPVGFLLMQAVVSHPITGGRLVFGALILCCVGLLLPSGIVSRLASARRTALEYEFPDALDLMVVCVEAGLSLDAAFIRVGQEVWESHPRIAVELGRLSEQLRAGQSHADALRAMADRTQVPAIKSFSALVIQSENLGAAIAQTLRIYSTEMRQTRFLKAEEKAMRIPVLMTIPLVCCILPVIVTALLLPAIIDAIRNLIPALTGHHGGG
jgi:tight adherence protein C